MSLPCVGPLPVVLIPPSTNISFFHLPPSFTPLGLRTRCSFCLECRSILFCFLSIYSSFKIQAKQHPFTEARLKY